MEKISFFLEKFKSLGLGDIAVKKIFSELVEKHLNLKLELADIVIREGVLYVKASPALKSELFIKRQFFLKELSNNLGPTKISGLR